MRLLLYPTGVKALAMKLLLPLGSGIESCRVTSALGRWVCFPKRAREGREARQGPEWPAGTLATVEARSYGGWQALGETTVEIS